MEETESAWTEVPVDEPNQNKRCKIMSQRKMTQETLEEQDSGSTNGSHDDCAIMTGKLCQRVMALIKWQCGMDKAVDNRMVWVLEGWLHNRGISIYTDLLKLRVLRSKILLTFHPHHST
jgi:hypothetical protein